MKPRGYQRNEAEILEAFQEQRNFLRVSCAAYDEGMFAEAKRIANAIAILVFDGSAKSIMTQLGVRKTTTFVSTAKPIDPTVSPKLALAGALGLPEGHGFEILPWLAAPEKIPAERALSFAKWWDEIVFQETHWVGSGQPSRPGAKLSRGDLIKSIRNADNGAHFDKWLNDQTYVNLAYARKLGLYKINDNGTPAEFLNPHLASLRQIGYEIERSLMPFAGGPTIPDLEPFPPKAFRAPRASPNSGTITPIPPEAWSESVKLPEMIWRRDGFSRPS